MQNSKTEKKQTIVPKIGRSTVYNYRGEANSYPFFSMVSRLVVSDYNANPQLLADIISRA